MNDIQTNVYVSHNISMAGYEVGFLQKSTHTGKRFYGAITFEEMAAGEYKPPAMMLNKDDLQFLMDELWNLGVRPERDQDVKNIINAKDSHIDDLRKIAFKGLGVKL